jgi:hypothetical protein
MIDARAADTLQPVLRDYLAALNAVANADPEPIKALCSRREDMSQCGLWGGVERGWEEVSQRWDWVAAQFVAGSGSVTTEMALATATAEMAYTVCVERWAVQLASRTEPGELVIRVTLIFRLEDGVWKAVHRHGDDRIVKEPPR